MPVQMLAHAHWAASQCVLFERAARERDERREPAPAAPVAQTESGLPFVDLFRLGLQVVDGKRLFAPLPASPAMTPSASRLPPLDFRRAINAATRPPIAPRPPTLAQRAWWEAAERDERRAWRARLGPDWRVHLDPSAAQRFERMMDNTARAGAIAKRVYSPLSPAPRTPRTRRLANTRSRTRAPRRRTARRTARAAARSTEPPPPAGPPRRRSSLAPSRAGGWS